VPVTGSGGGERARSAAQRRGTRGNVPVELTDFVGRRRELARVKRLSTASRLVTLTGVGGVGKTRLALRMAGEVRRTYTHGVWFVDFTLVAGPGLPIAETQDADVLASVVLATLGMPEQGHASLEQLTGYLRERQVLLVLDNCEHVVAGCARLADALVTSCPGVRVLATSREPLGVAGEVLCPVPPLRVPRSSRREPPGDLVGYESVALFLARARAARPDFALTDDNGDAVAELCRRLDGLPLAIELAAARVRALAPQQIVDRLTDRFALLARGRRDAPSRQQTLQACVEWSFELCMKPERLLWARLSVFDGGFDLDAAEAVCTDDALLPEDVIDVLTGLVDKSVVTRLDTGDDDGPQTGQPGRTARYRMLETIRAFGRQQLTECGDLQAMRRRHADWYAQLAARASTEWVSDRQTSWYTRLIQEHPNLRAAIEFLLTDADDAEAALRIIRDVPRLYWWWPGMWREGLGWLERALTRVTAPTPLRAYALIQAADLTAWQGDADRVRRLLDDGEDLAQRVQDTHTLAFVAYIRAHTDHHRSDLTGTIETTEHGLALLASMPEPDVAMQLPLLLTMGGYAAATGDHDLAGRSFAEALRIAAARGELVCRSTATWGLGVVAWNHGELAEAERLAADAIRIDGLTGRQDRYVTALSTDVLAWVAARREEYSRAATLLGIIDTLTGDAGKPLPAMQLRDHDACELQTRTALGDATFTRTRQHGQALERDAAIAYALGERHERTPATAPATTAFDPLTRRERQIAELIAQGLPNKTIASTLTISRRTVEGHVDHILTKLGFTSRAQIAAWIADERPPD
jgi:predicted ATPase/DNA-binding CsgD family transcriptional regulator